MIAKKGFSLIECLIYCALLCFLCGFVCNVFIQNASMARHYHAKAQHAMALHAALNCIMRDIEQAKSASQSWDFSSPNQFICQVLAESVGWEIHQGNLYRLVGDYNFNEGKWHRKSRALVARNIDGMQYAIEHVASQVAGITLSLEGYNQKLERHISLINGMIL